MHGPTDEFDVPVRVGVTPPHEWRARRRLFGALQDAYPVSFEPRQSHEWRGLDAMVLIGIGAPADWAGQIPRLLAAGPERFRAAAGSVALARDESLDRALRGAALSDGWTGHLTPDGAPGCTRVLATVDGHPAWAAGELHTATVAAAPDELGEDEGLRNRLAPGRCLALLALVQFLRRLSSGRGWDPPPLRAAFVLDDPNLHWRSYGHVRYQELALHAAEHAYHVAIAMVPLDGWLAHPGVVRRFRASSAQLSICVHGNDHHGPELGRITSEDSGVALAGQALARAARFQRRTGLRVDEVMVPPHERLSEPAARALLACGFSAVCASRPYPWIASASLAPRWSGGPADAGALAGFTPREIVAGGLPLLLRAGIDAPREDIVLRAFLGQPLILYGHHDLLEHGPGVLAEAAAAINAVGEVRWCSLGGVAQSGVETRHRGERLEARVLARRTALSLPAGARELRVDARPLQLPAGVPLLATVTGARGVSIRTVSLGADSCAVLPLDGGYQAELSFRVAPVRARIMPPRRRVRTVVRRAATESLDRAQALRSPLRQREVEQRLVARGPGVGGDE